MIKKLLVDENPPIQTVNGYGFPLSIIGGHHNTYIPWVVSNFLNIAYHPLHFWKRLDRLCFKKSAYFFWSFFRFRIKFLVHRDEIVPHLKRELDKENYVALFLNEYFIPGKSSYQKRNNIHDKYIYGYNDDSSVFYVLSIADKGQYKKHEISYDAMRRAYSFYSLNHCFFAFQLRDYDFTKLNDRKIKKQLRHYLRNRKNYGIHCYDLIINHFESLAPNQEINMLILRMFKEHKTVLSFLNDSFSSIQQQFDVLFFWCIKYNLCFDPSILDRQIVKLQRMKSEEYALIKAYLG